MKYFDIENKRIIFLINITNEYWDDHWLKIWNKDKQDIYKPNPRSLVCKITPKFLRPKDGPILEGGCGLGLNVYYLKNMKYDVFGIDNAKILIETIKKEMPNLNLQIADVCKIPFPDNYFAGYWSLGVIEHFFNGYLEIIQEMKRVIKPNGYLFITFPYMSPFRIIKSKINLYKIFNNKLYDRKEILKSFYQYALNKDIVIKDFQNNGFKLIYTEPEDGIKGIKDEIFFLKFFLKKFLQLLYDSEKPKFILLIREIINKIFVKFSGHDVLLILQKM